ncbi:hypothetical protein DSO57_1039637 [Entomophthora muscae]|uniref:Uncharacterized protein n=1 Tax=Entomophthora muscae TaxID=34485 RepID=A0ACC2TNS6_9FUNG|nr:hypothetical protein DSO57_1039637 [Entomophthora muscae]
MNFSSFTARQWGLSLGAVVIFHSPRRRARMLFLQYDSVIILLIILGLPTRYVCKVSFSSFPFGRRLFSQFCALACAGLWPCASMLARNNFPHNLLAFCATGAAVALFHRKVLVIDSTFFSKASVKGTMCATYQILEYTNTLSAFAFDPRSSCLYLHLLMQSTRSDSRFCSIASWEMSFEVNRMPRCLKGRCGSIDFIPTGGWKSGKPILTVTVLSTLTFALDPRW